MDLKMNNLSDMLWVEYRKAIRSRMPLWTALGSLFLPFGMAFLITVARNPVIFQQLGLVTAKANLLSFSTIDWPGYLDVYGQIIAVGGFFLFILIVSWTFGREFTDGTLKDMLAVPVQRSSILLAKFIVVAAWSAGMAIFIFLCGLLIGAIIGFPNGSSSAIFHGSARVLIATCLVIPVALPFALFASIGRGYLLPIGLAILMSIATNLIVVLGWGDYFPWAVPALYVQGTTPLALASYLIVLLTGIAGMIATYLWWKYVDQNR
jgi:ABC-2 type transport system permease protein